jgi:hypothetical protein
MLTKYTSLLAIPFVALVGCGGDDGETPKPKPDAAVNNPVDAPPAATCSISPEAIGGLTLTGSMAVDNYIIPDAGSPNEGVKTLIFGAALPDSKVGNIADWMVFEAVRPSTGYIPEVPYNFDPNPAADTYVAAAYIFGDSDLQNTLANFYYAKNGSITFTSITEGTGTIAGSVSAVMYREIDDQGAEVTTGCHPSTEGVDFMLMQKAGAVARTTEQGASGFTPMTTEQLQRAWKIIQQRKLARGTR